MGGVRGRGEQATARCNEGVGGGESRPLRDVGRCNEGASYPPLPFSVHMLDNNKSGSEKCSYTGACLSLCGHGLIISWHKRCIVCGIYVVWLAM